MYADDIVIVGNLLYEVVFKFSEWRFSIISEKVYCCPAFYSHCGEYCEVIGNIHEKGKVE